MPITPRQAPAAPATPCDRLQHGLADLDAVRDACARAAVQLDAGELDAMPALADGDGQRRALDGLAAEADDDRRGDIRVAGDLLEGRSGLQPVVADLAAAVLMRDRDCAERVRDVRGDPRRTHDRRQHQQVPATAGGTHRAASPGRRALSTLWTCTCAPTGIARMATPMTSPYL